jgi:membrane-associated protease RseP (regulator of RpoE activity)
MPTMDPEPIPAEPTIDPEPPDATSLATGPSLASESPAAGRGRGSKVRRAVIGLALVLTFSVGIGVGGLASSALSGAGTAPTPTSGSTNFGLIKEAWDILHTKYVGADTLDDKALIYGAINGMTEAVGDTGHTSFMTPEQRTARSNDLSGKFVGIGVRVDVAKDGLPLIVGVFKDSPAEKAGLVVGDEIVAVDGKTTAGQQMSDVISWVRGEAGTTVVVTARTGATGTSRDVSMVRADVAIDPVSWTLVTGTKTALIIVHSVLTLPFTVLILTIFFRRIPRDIEEAALLDGCNRAQVFLRIMLPLSRTSVFATGVFAFILSYAEFLFALVLSGDAANRPLSVVMAALARNTDVSWGLLNASVFLAVIPTVALIGVVWRFVVEALLERGAEIG